MCWVALDRGVRLARDRDEGERAERWRAAADAIREEVLDEGVSPRGVFRQHYDTEDLDAALLLIPIMGFLPPDDERVRATVLAIADELTEDGLVLRYRTESTDTGFEGKEGTFTICSFWLVSALAMIGETSRSARSVREAALLRRAAPPLRRRDRCHQWPAPWKFPPGFHPSSPDRGGLAAHRGGKRRHHCMIARKFTHPSVDERRGKGKGAPRPAPRCPPFPGGAGPGRVLRAPRPCSPPRARRFRAVLGRGPLSPHWTPLRRQVAGPRTGRKRRGAGRGAGAPPGTGREAGRGGGGRPDPNSGRNVPARCYGTLSGG